MNNIIKKIFGISKIEEETAIAVKAKIEAEEAAARAINAAKISKLSPKELATQNKEPWIDVLETHVDMQNLRNGFFELDWNEYFILQLRNAGYTGETDEAVVDQWFKVICSNVGAEEGVSMDRRGAGYINISNLGDGRTEVS